MIRRRLLVVVGRIGFYAVYPFLALYLSKDDRTRVVVIHEGRVLLVRSWLTEVTWDLPGGGLHKGEDPALGVARELSEEVGIKDVAVHLLRSEPFKAGLIRYQAHYFCAEIATKPSLTLQAAEIIDAQWFSAAQVQDLTMYSQHRRVVLDALKQSIADVS